MIWRWAAGLGAVAFAFLVLDAGSMSGAVARVSAVIGRMAPVLTMLGGLAGANALRLRSLRNKAARWPTTSGVITQAEVMSKTMRRFWDQSRSGSMTKRRYYQPAVRYTYEVGGGRFSGDRVQVGGRFGVGGWGSDRAAADAEVAPYTAGQPVMVHYDPSRPGESVLDLRMSRRWRQSVIFAAVTLALGLYGLL